MTPDAIIIFSAGLVSYEDDKGEVHWRSTTYKENDGFGTMGGRDRVEAAALLAKKYPDAYLVTTCQRMDGSPPSHASVYAGELIALGVPQERIVQEDISTNVWSSIQQLVLIAQEKGWKHLLLLSSEYQLSRIKAFYEEEKCDVEVVTISSESVLGENDPTFIEYFESVKKTPSYQKRLVAETRGVVAVKNGTYRPAPIEDKMERPA